MCGGALAQPPEVVTDTNWNLHRCRHCGALATDITDAPPPEQLYPSFSQSEAGAARTGRSLASRFLRRRVQVVRESTRGRRVLDFGAGNGDFCAALCTAGYDAVGVEPFSLGETQLRDNPTQLYRSWKDRDDLGRFDAITLWHVLEHLHNPVEVLTNLRSRLAPGGCLIISVPNERSWQRRVFRTSWFHLDPPRHVLHLDRATLADTLSRAGMTIEKSFPFLPEYGTSGWVQSVLNVVLPRRNFLYEFTKDRGALVGIGKGSYAAHLLVSVALGVPLFATAWVVEAVAARRDAAAALTVKAVLRPHQSSDLSRGAS